MFESVKNCGAGKFISHGMWIHPDRVIDSYEMILVTKGEVYISENGTDYPLKKDEILILRPHLHHFGYRASEHTEFFWLHWYSETDLLPDFKHRRIENPYNICLYMRQLLDARVTQKTSEGIDCLTRLILLELYANSKPPVSHHIAEKIADWIRANSYAPLTEKQIAEHFGYNADYLNRLFKSNYSKSIKQYIDEKRMEHIKRLMLSDELPLKEIASRSGFTEYKYFLKFFKYHEAITPTEFYRQYKMKINSR